METKRHETPWQVRSSSALVGRLESQLLVGYQAIWPDHSNTSKVVVQGHQSLVRHQPYPAVETPISHPCVYFCRFLRTSCLLQVACTILAKKAEASGFCYIIDVVLSILCPHTPPSKRILQEDIGCPPFPPPCCRWHAPRQEG